MHDGQPLPYFQPLIDTATGRIAGYEALARLRLEDGRIVSAGPLFTDPQTDPDALLELDRSIRQQALELFRDQPEGFISINISPLWISRLNSEQPLPSLQLLEQLGMQPGQLVFEITELQGDIRQLRDAVARYRAHGIRVAIDDFGAGASMLDRLLDLEPDIIKLDAQLLRQAANGNSHSREFVRALALMAERSGCEVIAEGIENQRELHFALECGARFVQGYLFSEPHEGFQPVDSYVEPFASMRDAYVKQQQQERQRLAVLRQSLHTLFGELRQWLEQGAAPQRLPDPARWPWLLRCYLCDAEGTQISPNFDATATGWETDPALLDHNWSWRPYFHQILEEAGEDSRVILSSPYRDASSQALCMTSGLFFNDSRHLLLVDIDASRIPATPAA